MNTTSFDTLNAMQRLEQAGMERAHAEAIVGTVRDAQTALATKADLKTGLFATRAELKADLFETKAELKADLLETKAELKADLLETKAELKADLLELRADLYRALWIQGAGIVAINSAFIATAAALGLI